MSMPSIRPVLVIASFFCLSMGMQAQDSTTPPAPSDETTTIRGCLEGERGNYILVEKNSMVYVLKGVGNKLDSYLTHQVEVKGIIQPGTVKTGSRAEKAGSNPSDTLHAVDGIPFEVKNPLTDVHTIAKHCKAADAQ
jgi:hypothetical protein